MDEWDLGTCEYDRAQHIHKFSLAQLTNFNIFWTDHMELRRKVSSKPLAWLRVLLDLGRQALMYEAEKMI